MAEPVEIKYIVLDPAEYRVKRVQRTRYGRKVFFFRLEKCADFGRWIEDIPAHEDLESLDRAARVFFRETINGLPVV